MNHIKDLRPDPKNRRKHNPRNIGMLVDALHAVGAARSIVIDEHGEVLAGNGVAEAAAEAGITNVQVVDADGSTLVAVRRTGLTEEQKRALAIYDNRVAELAEWDWERLAQDQAEGLTLEPWFTDQELAAGLKVEAKAGNTDPDAVPEERPTGIVAGDLFELGRHRLLCGDSTSGTDVAQVFGQNHAGLCFTSPPYADQRTYAGDCDLTPEHLSRFLTVAEPYVDVFAVNLGIARRDGFVLRYWDAYISAAELSGMGLLSWNVWSREGLQMSIGQATAMFPIQHEWIIVFGRRPVDLRPTVPNKSAGHTGTSTDRCADGVMGAGKRVTIRERRELGTVLTMAPVSNNADHPAQFPVELARAYIEAFHGSVYEPFSGAGTTIIACEELGRSCVAIEIAPKYCQVAIDRWEAFTGQKAQKVGEAVSL